MVVSNEENITIIKIFVSSNTYCRKIVVNIQVDREIWLVFPRDWTVPTYIAKRVISGLDG